MKTITEMRDILNLDENLGLSDDAIKTLYNKHLETTKKELKRKNKRTTFHCSLPRWLDDEYGEVVDDNKATDQLDQSEIARALFLYYIKGNLDVPKFVKTLSEDERYAVYGQRKRK